MTPERTARLAERVVEIARAFAADPNNDAKRLAYLKATFNLDQTAEVIVYLAEIGMPALATRAGSGRAP